MAIRTYDILLDSHNTMMPEPITGRAGDKTGAVAINATLADNGAPVSLVGKTTMFMANAPDGKHVIADTDNFKITDAPNGQFTYNVPNNLWNFRGGGAKSLLRILIYLMTTVRRPPLTYGLLF
ncbi:BppU family phage baseplate upper protein [Lactiplantibacillus paraxiangfangensis]|uniref:BppU family phage baseplate upper protein n=1 Tax=Lactiplantibacillus paraxiangfangensis TaxID=3076224 RepID=UPI0030C70478